MKLLERFAADWNLKIEGERIPGIYGFIMEREGQIWVWSHSYSPNGHEFFPIATGYDEIKAVLRLIGWKL